MTNMPLSELAERRRYSIRDICIVRAYEAQADIKLIAKIGDCSTWEARRIIARTIRADAAEKAGQRYDKTDPDCPVWAVLDFGPRVLKALVEENVRTIGDAAQLSDSQLLRIPNFGKKSLKDFRAVMDDIRLRRAASE